MTQHFEGDGCLYDQLFTEAIEGESFAGLGRLAHDLSRVVDEGWTPEPPARALIVVQALRALAAACQLYRYDGPAVEDAQRRLIAGGSYNAAQLVQGMATLLADSLPDTGAVHLFLPADDEGEDGDG